MVPISYLGGTHPVVFSTWASRTANGLAGESRDFFLGLAGEKGFYFLGFVHNREWIVHVEKRPNSGGSVKLYSSVG